MEAVTGPARPWWRERPCVAGALVIFGGILGALAGVAIAAGMVTQHLVSPDNVWAGGACGFGGVILGALAAMLAVADAGGLRRRHRERTRANP